MSKKVLINASNLHVGGAVQVAVSYIKQLLLESPPFSYDVLLSTEVYTNLSHSVPNIGSMANVHLCDTNVLSMFNLNLRKQLSKYHLVFTIFGPLYFIGNRSFLSVVGFAQPWIAYPKNPIYKKLSTHKTILTKFKYFLQSKFFGKSDVIIVEAEHVRDQIAQLSDFKNKLIYVVPNEISFHFMNIVPECKFKPGEFSTIRIGYLGRAYLHKNIDLLLEVCMQMRKKFNVGVECHLSLNAHEISNIDPKYASIIRNHGVVPVKECFRFYQSVDCIVFLSQLECFSATPIEANFMLVPIFALSAVFNDEATGRNYVKLESLDPERIALDVYKTMSSGLSYDLQAAHNRASQIMNLSNRFRDYNKIIKIVGGLNVQK